MMRWHYLPFTLSWWVGWWSWLLLERSSSTRFSASSLQSSSLYLMCFRSTLSRFKSDGMDRSAAGVKQLSEGHLLWSYFYNDLILCDCGRFSLKKIWSSSDVNMEQQNKLISCSLKGYIRINHHVWFRQSEFSGDIVTSDLIRIKLSGFIVSWFIRSSHVRQDVLCDPFISASSEDAFRWKLSIIFMFLLIMLEIFFSPQVLKR